MAKNRERHLGERDAFAAALGRSFEADGVKHDDAVGHGDFAPNAVGNENRGSILHNWGGGCTGLDCRKRGGNACDDQTRSLFKVRCGDHFISAHGFIQRSHQRRRDGSGSRSPDVGEMIDDVGSVGGHAICIKIGELNAPLPAHFAAKIGRGRCEIIELSEGELLQCDAEVCQPVFITQFSIEVPDSAQ